MLRLVCVAVALRTWSAATATGEVEQMDPRALAGTGPIWDGTTVHDLHREYSNIFKFGNRNAASHLWASFLIERAWQMSVDRVTELFTGFCAVSGSPVTANDYRRYLLNLPHVDGSGKQSGIMYYCCWPCVCDTQDYIRVDTKTITTADGPVKMRVAVIGNPCHNPEKLDEPFVQPFDRRTTTLSREAREVRCNGSTLEGATLSDHGYIIISLFFDLPGKANDSVAIASAEDSTTPVPGRMTTLYGTTFQNEYEYSDECTRRADAGYNSGMGEIFRKVAAISPINEGSARLLPAGIHT